MPNISRMHNPPHPGEVLKELYMEPAELTVTHVANHIGVDRKTLSRVLNGRAQVTVEMAIRLARAFNTSERLWLGMQQAYDLWQVKKERRVDVARIRPFEMPSHP